VGLGLPLPLNGASPPESLQCVYKKPAAGLQWFCNKSTTKSATNACNDAWNDHHEACNKTSARPPKRSSLWLAVSRRIHLRLAATEHWVAHSMHFTEAASIGQGGSRKGIGQSTHGAVFARHTSWSLVTSVDASLRHFPAYVSGRLLRRRSGLLESARAVWVIRNIEPRNSSTPRFGGARKARLRESPSNRELRFKIVARSTKSCLQGRIKGDRKGDRKDDRKDDRKAVAKGGALMAALKAPWTKP
jgi:hypothetical protein